MSKTLKALRRLRTKETCRQEDRGGDSLLLMVVADYGGRDIAPLLDFTRRLTPFPDLLLYAGDNVDCSDPLPIDQLRKLAAATKCGLCAIAGKPGTLDGAPLRKSPIVPTGVGRAAGRNRSGEVHDVHREPLVVGNYAVIGAGGCTKESNNGRRTRGVEPKVDTKYVRSAAMAVAGRHMIVLCREPPVSSFDLTRQGNRHSGSDALRQFVLRRKDVPLLIAGGAGFGGGKSRRVGHSLVVNVASHSDPRQPGRVGMIEMRDGKVANVSWHSIWDLASIPGIDEKRRASLKRAGICTLRDLFECSNQNLARMIRSGYSESAHLRAQASAFLRQDVVVMRGFSLPHGNRAYLTVESCSARDDIRLVGLLLEDRTNILLAETPDEERQILAELVRLLTPAPKVSVICYSVSLWQQQLLSRRLAHHGLPAQIIQSLRNIYFDIADAVAFPTRHLGLREVAECCGFKWRNPRGTSYDVVQFCSTSEKLTRTQRRVLTWRGEENLRALRQIVVYLEQVLVGRTMGGHHISTDSLPKQT